MVRTEGVVDTTSRMVTVIVAISNPADRSGEGKEMIPGMFAEVAIHGKRLHEVMTIPRHALRDEGNVWIVVDDRLTIAEVEVARTDDRSAYIVSGIEENSLVVVSSLDIVTNGMNVRTRMRSQGPGATEADIEKEH